MADSDVKVTEGAGKNVKTRNTPLGKEQQVIVLGVPDTDTVVPASVEFGSTVDVKRTVASGTSVVTSVAGSATSVTLLAANSNRLGGTVFNDSASDLYIKMGATASASSFTIKLFQDDYWEAPFRYTGVIAGIWASAIGNARITELT